MFPSWRQWLKRVFPQGGRAVLVTRWRLQVEVLEDRMAPAALGSPLDKLGSGLAAVLGEYQAYVASGGAPAAFHSSQAQGLKLIGDKLLVEIHGQGDWNSLMTKLVGYQFSAGLADAAHKLADGYLPLGQVTAVANLANAMSINPIFATHSTDSQGTVANQAETTLKADIARHLFGVDGTGITIGVISDSANDVGGGIANSQASGNLPPGSRVQDLLDQPGGTDEGRAMMELIYDIAPGVNLKFASGQVTGGGAVSDASMANAVNTLVASGCNIIVDDLNGLTSEPYFQDGLAAQAVSTAIAGGISYFSSAGNRGLSGYEAPFHGLTTTVAGMSGRWNDFGGGDPTQTVTIQPGGAEFVFQYDDPYYGGTGVTHNADFFILNAAGTAVIASGTTNNLTAGGTGVPREIVVTGVSGTVQIAIRATAGGDIGRFKYIGFGDPIIVDHLADPGALISAANPGHNSVGIAVAAAAVTTPTTPESFTAQGPVTRLFDTAGTRIALQTRNDPDVTSNDGAHTSVPGFSSFFGTSAAAPNAAAIGALLLQYHPTLTPAQMRTTLMNTATDITTGGAGTGVGYDFRTGSGLINAVTALQSITGSPTLNGDFDSVNENDKFQLNLEAGDPTKIDVTVNNTLLGFWNVANVTAPHVKGLGGNDALTIDAVNGAVPVQVNYDGGIGTNDLDVLNQANIWHITANNGGDVNGTANINFANTQNLLGGANTDSFVFSDGKSVGGTVDGGTGAGLNSLDYSAYTTPVIINLSTNTATATGSVKNFQQVTGGQNNDTITGNSTGITNIFASPGSDTVTGIAGSTNTLFGANAISTWNVTGANKGTLTFGTNSTDFTSGTVQNLTGGTLADSFIITGAGITGVIDGGGGSNTLTGPNQTDTWAITAPDQGSITGVVGTFKKIQNLVGGTGRDAFQISGGGSVSGSINGTSGGDFLDYSSKPNSVVVNLTTGAASFTGGILNIQNVIGSAVGGDSLTGNALGNVLIGHGSGNRLIAGSGRSVLFGGYGVNTITGGASGDLLINGSTTYDGDYVALAYILGVWQGATPYSTRIANLQNTPSVTDHFNKLTVGVTVFVFPGLAIGGRPGLRLGRGGSSTIVNSMLTGNGGAGDERNWFITNSPSTVADQKPGEVVTTS